MLCYGHLIKKWSGIYHSEFLVWSMQKLRKEAVLEDRLSA